MAANKQNSPEIHKCDSLADKLVKLEGLAKSCWSYPAEEGNPQAKLDHIAMVRSMIVALNSTYHTVRTVWDEMGYDMADMFAIEGFAEANIQRIRKATDKADKPKEAKANPLSLL